VPVVGTYRDVANHGPGCGGVVSRREKRGDDVGEGVRGSDGISGPSRVQRLGIDL